MKSLILKLNRTVFEMWTGIIIYGLVCELGVLLVPLKKVYSISLWCGIVTALAASFHMWWSINRALEAGEAEAPKKMSVQYIIRYTCLVIVLGIFGMSVGSYVLATFLGILGVKAGAYLQPITKKISVFIYGEEILPPIIYEDDALENGALMGEGGNPSTNKSPV